MYDPIIIPKQSYNDIIGYRLAVLLVPPLGGVQLPTCYAMDKPLRRACQGWQAFY